MQMHLTRLRISGDPAKRDKTLRERGLDFEDAFEVFQGLTVEVEDARKDDGERRILCALACSRAGSPWSVTPRVARRVTSSACEGQRPKANDRGRTRLAPYFGL